MERFGSWDGFGCKTFEEFHRLRFQSRFMEVEQAFHFICPDNSITALLEKRHGPTKGVDKNPCGFATLGGFEGRVEFAKEVMRSIRSHGMDHEVKSRGADQVQPWKIVPGSQNTANRDVGPVEFPQALQQDLWRTGPHGGISEGLGESDDFRLRDQPEPRIFGKGLEFDPPVRMPEEVWLQFPKSI